MMRIFILPGLLMLLLAACTSAPSPSPVATSPPEAVTPTNRPTEEPAATPEEAGVNEPAPLPSSPPAGPAVEPPVEPIEVTYFTPAQGEGPYYTVDKPADRDNDLTEVAGQSGPPAGQVLEFSGRVYGAAGLPVAGAVIEIWQTDNNGVYLHPNDPATGERDPNFQFYGEAVTDTGGRYWFRT
ncbi:MAG: hypothetical protein R3335_15085, partial [Anaerolineales bacterium]|nr:hypothetical protein [Anaerolineales bacterium]